MNGLYLSILKNNCRRFFFSKVTWVVYFMYIFWVVFFAISLYGTGERGPVFILVFTVVYALLVSEYFWLFGWAIGDVDPMTSMHTAKNRNDRFYMIFMSTLPLDRVTHYAIQVFLYIMLCTVLCLTSLLLQLLFPLPRTYLSLVVFSHFLAFSIFLLVGAAQTLTALPYAFRGEINTLTHPVVLRGFAFGILFVAAVSAFNIEKPFFSHKISGDLAQQLFDNPIWLLGVYIIIVFLFFVGGKKFSAQEIK